MKMNKKKSKQQCVKYASSSMYCSPDPKLIPKPIFDDCDNDESCEKNMLLKEFIDLFLTNSLDYKSISSESKILLETAVTSLLKTNEKFIFCLYIKSTNLKIQFVKNFSSNLTSIKVNDTFLCKNSKLMSVLLKIKINFGYDLFLQSEEITFFMYELLKKLCNVKFSN